MNNENQKYSYNSPTEGQYNTDVHLYFYLVQELTYQVLVKHYEYYFHFCLYTSLFYTMHTMTPKTHQNESNYYYPADTLSNRLSRSTYFLNSRKQKNHNEEQHAVFQR